MSQERGAAVATRLLQLAGPQLYRANAFRVTGLPTDASGREVRERRKRITTALAVGAPVQLGGVLPLPEPPAPDQVRSAFDELGDAQRRIVNELLWFWGADGGGGSEACGCPSSLHRHHDAAIRAHVRALDLELGGEAADRLWAEAASQWSALLRRAGFWDHVRYRIRILDDRRLDESTIDALRDTLPRAVVMPVVALASAAEQPARLAGHARRWDVGEHVVDDLLAEAAEPITRQLRGALDRAAQALEQDRARDAADGLRGDVVPKLHRLEGLRPAKRHRGTASLSEGVALLLNNSALALTPSEEAQSLRLLDTAATFAVSSDTRTLIKNNRTDLQQRRSLNRELAQFGVNAENAAERVTTLLTTGQLMRARQILEVLRRYIDDPGEAAEIDKLLARLTGATGGWYVPPARPARPARPAVSRTPSSPATRAEPAKLTVGSMVGLGLVLLLFPALLWLVFNGIAGLVGLGFWAIFMALVVIGSISERNQP